MSAADDTASVEVLALIAGRAIDGLEQIGTLVGLGAADDDPSEYASIAAQRIADLIAERDRLRKSARAAATESLNAAMGQGGCEKALARVRLEQAHLRAECDNIRRERDAFIKADEEDGWAATVVRFLTELRRVDARQGNALEEIDAAVRRGDLLVGAANDIRHALTGVQP